MKILDSTIAGPSKFLAFLILPFSILLLLIRLIQWPVFFEGWEGDSSTFSANFKMGIAGLFFCIIYIYWIMRHLDYYRHNRKDLIIYTLIGIAFYLLPVINLIVLGVASQGFKLSPTSDGGNLLLYEQWQDTRTYFFIGTAILAIVNMKFNRKSNGSLHLGTDPFKASLDEK